LSHFTVVEIEATDASCLIEALEVLGYTDKIEVHDRPATPIGYDGSPRLLGDQGVRAEIITRRHILKAAPVPQLARFFPRRRSSGQTLTTLTNGAGESRRSSLRNTLHLSMHGDQLD